MGTDYQAEVAEVVAGFLADVDRIGRDFLLQQHERLLGEIAPSPATRSVRTPATTTPQRQAAVASRPATSDDAQPRGRRSMKLAGAIPAKMTRAKATSARVASSKATADEAPPASSPPTRPPPTKATVREAPPTSSPAPTSSTPVVEGPVIAASAPAPIAPAPVPDQSAAATPKAPDPNQRRGVVLWYSIEKGYGFIRGDDGNDAFVHASALDGFGALADGQPVTYTVAWSRKGLQAVSVERPSPRARGSR